MTTATMPPPTVTLPRHEPLMLDWLLPDFDATLIEHRVIDGDPGSVYRAVTTVDLAEIGRSNPALRVLFAARGAAERVASALLRRPAPRPEPAEAIRLGDMPEHGDWVELSDDPPSEFSFGVIGRFWGGETVWEQIDAADFAAFERPGFAKIACSVSLRPYGSVRTLVTYEARTRALDAESRAAFLRYWRLVRPGVSIVMRAFLQAVAKEVRDAAAP
jgi:hypothetical protein